MNHAMAIVLLTAGVTTGAPSAPAAEAPRISRGAESLATRATSCAADAVAVGTVCLDKYEESVWRVPDPSTTNAGLVSRIRLGKATVADLELGGATPLGTARDDYAPCTDDGQSCANDIFAVSLSQVTPSRFITWFQAQQACTSARKRLPTNAEWQAAVAGTPDPGPDNGTTDCNTASTFQVAATGSRASCVSAEGAFDMVGNLFEWVADWVPRSTACGSWSISATNDLQCLAGAAVAGEPGALLRGGSSISGELAGPLAVLGTLSPARSDDNVGFRCVR
jgi:hypothetical protein